MNFTVKYGKVALTDAADTWTKNIAAVEEAFTAGAKAVINTLAPLGQAKSTEGVTYTLPSLEIYSSSRIAVITSFSVTRVCTMAFVRSGPSGRRARGFGF